MHLDKRHGSWVDTCVLDKRHLIRSTRCCNGDTWGKYFLKSAIEIYVPLSLSIIRPMEMVMPGLCFLIQGNMNGAGVTFGQPIRPTKVPIYQKPQNCRFVHTEESGQKRRGRIEGGELIAHYPIEILFKYSSQFGLFNYG